MSGGERCDRFDREGALRLERGEPQDEHAASCPDCIESHRRYLRVAAALRDAGHAERPRPGWEMRVLGAASPAISDASARRGAAGGRRIGIGTALVVTAHAMVVAAAIHVSTHPGPHEIREEPVVKRAQQPTAQDPAASREEAAPRRAPDAPPEALSEVPPAVSVVGGAPDRPIPRAPAPAPEPLPAPEYVVPFGEGMTLPSGLRGCEPNYTPQAMAARVEGLAIVECIIRADGTNTSCEILKGLPHMDEALLKAMNGCRSTPITFQGEPVDNVAYTWRIWLKPPG